MVRCHEGVARWLVTCVLVMLRGKAKNQNIIFFYTRNHELSSGPALKDVHAMPEPRWNRAAMKGALVVVGGVRRLLEAIFRSIGRETSDLAVNPEWKRLASERCGVISELIERKLLVGVICDYSNCGKSRGSEASILGNCG